MKKYFSFYGRAKRLEYWGVQIFLFLFFVVFNFLGGFILIFSPLFLVIIPILIITIWLTLSVIVRRLRDAGMNVWLVLLILLPLLNGIVGIVFGCIPSKK